MSQAFIDSIRRGDLVEAERLLREDRVDINYAAGGDGQNATALHIAAEVGNIDAVNFLIQRGANVNRRCMGGWTPMHLAARHGHTEIVKTLIASGAEKGPRLVGDDVAPIHLATQFGHVGVIEVLAQDPQVRDASMAEGYKALHVAARYGKLEAFNCLIQAGCNPKAVVANASSVVHVAAFHNQPALVQAAIRAKVDPNQLDLQGFTALHIAAIRGHGAAAKALLENGAHPDLGSVQAHEEAPESQRAIEFAAFNARIDVLEALVAHGASISPQGPKARTPLRRAVSSNHPNHVEGFAYLLLNVANPAQYAQELEHLLRNKPACRSLLTGEGVVRTSSVYQGDSSAQNAIAAGHPHLRGPNNWARNILAPAGTEAKQPVMG